MNEKKKKDLLACISYCIVASTEKKNVSILLDSVMFIVKDKLCFWDAVFSGEFEI